MVMSRHENTVCLVLRTMEKKDLPGRQDNNEEERRKKMDNDQPTTNDTTSQTTQKTASTGKTFFIQSE